MNEKLKKVKVFQQVFDNPILNIEDFITTERAKLRLSLALEELTELADALGLASTFSKMLINKATEKLHVDTNLIDKIEVLDALCDIEYINNGTILECGLHECYDDAFNDVHESNMSKVCNTAEEAVLTVEDYHKKGVETYFKQSTNKYLVFRTSDNKNLKSINYKKVELAKYF